jgi:hypothetical protein
MERMNFAQKSCLLFVIPFLIFSSCSPTDEVELPEQIRELGNLTVYPTDAEPESEIQLIREEAFGDTEKIMIGSMGNIVVDERGRVFIADDQLYTIHVFNADGSYETAFGREGRGPEEFQSFSSMEIYDNQFYVYDYMQHRISSFSLDSFMISRMINLNTDNWSHIQDLENSFPAAPLFIRDSYTFLMRFRERPQPDHISYDRHYLLNDQGEIISDLIFKQRGAELLVTSEGGRITNVLPSPFIRNSLMVVSENGLIFSAWTEDFLIRIYDEEGNYLRSFYYPYPQSRLNRQDILELYQDQDPFVQQLYRNADFPDTWPALHHMLLDDEQRLWVSTISNDEEHYTWWVLNEGGQLLAKFNWPGVRLRRLENENMIEVIKDGYAYIREVNEETGHQQIVRYRIELEEI